MSECELVRLECRPEALAALAGHLESYGAVDGEPEWLVSAVWLRAGGVDYLATSSTKVLRDGYIARPLAIDRTVDFHAQMQSELPDIAARLAARTGQFELPEAALPPLPADLRRCSAPPVSTTVLIRLAQCRSAVHRVAGALLFEFDQGRRLLVGTDPATPAMVLSEDELLIDRYLVRSEALTIPAYAEQYCD